VSFQKFDSGASWSGGGGASIAPPPSPPPVSAPAFNYRYHYLFQSYGIEAPQRQLVKISSSQITTVLVTALVLILPKS